MTGLTRCVAAKIIAGYFGTDAAHVGGAYDTYTVRDQSQRVWSLKNDSSIRRQRAGGRYASEEYAVELVSPICCYEDIPVIQEVVRKLRSGGAKANESCGCLLYTSRRDPPGEPEAGRIHCDGTYR